ncbi:hypothetical protein [Oceanotoga teriensis]|uniref:hypothetical protein n=1 Tax=Oceanotoga teriensis TaxID=515440 RepID=UPI0027138C65|nr:hypothetical protein [Oceanotoga teriensis]MDO7976740.1 hypothetical protein [Oceanotoga teriensis]
MYSKLDDISSINPIDHLEDINSYYDKQKKLINKYFEVKGVMDKPETILSYEELEELQNKRVNSILEDDEEDPKNNVLVRLPMVLEYKGEQRVTTSIPFRIHVLRGLNKMLVSKDSAKIIKNNFKNNHKLFLFYKRIDIDELIHEYSLHKKDIISWFKRSKSVNSWFSRREINLLGQSKIFGHFSWDTQNKNNPGALIAPACNYIGYNHLSWIGVTANIYEKITGNFGKRTISNAILKSTKFRLSYINFDDVAISLKLDNKRVLKEREYSSCLSWVLQVSEFEDNLTTIGEGSLITKKANEVVSKQLNYKSLSEEQPIKVFFEGYGEKALTYAESKVSKICYSGTDKEVFTGDLKYEFVSFIKGYTKRENKEAIATSGRKRANKVLKNEDHAKSILVDAYDDKGSLVYERANLHLHKVFIDVTMDRTPKIVRQKISSELTKSLTIKSKRTKLDYSKHENKAKEKAKTMKLMLEFAYRTLSLSNPILNDHYIPGITPSKYSDFYLFNSEEEIALLLEHGIKIHGIWLRLPKYYEAIPNIGVSYNNILSLLYERIQGKPVDERTMFDDLDYVLKEIEAMYEKANTVYIDMVRSRLAIKENLKTQEMHVSPLVLEKLIEEFSDKYLKEFKKLGADDFVEKYKITVYAVRFPDFGYSGDYTITAVDNSLNYTSAISTLNAALIGGDIDDDTLQSKIIEISVK